MNPTPINTHTETSFQDNDDANTMHFNIVLDLDNKADTPVNAVGTGCCLLTIK